jgi:hypothetical protein
MPLFPKIPDPPLIVASERGDPSPGYPPSAPDLGRIQEAMRAALATLPAHALRHAWRREGVAWGWNFLKTWVRGLRRADLDLRGGRLDIHFSATGPGGTYDYAFAVRFGGRPPERRTDSSRLPPEA